MYKADLINELKHIKADELALKQKLYNQDGQVLFKGFDWVRSGLENRCFDIVYILRKLRAGYSKISNTLTISCDPIKFSCKAYLYEKGTIGMRMEDVRNAKGKNVEIIQSIIIDAMVDRAKRYGLPIFDGIDSDSFCALRELVRLDGVKRSALKELSMNQEPIRFTKKSLKEQLIANSFEQEELRRGLDIKHYAADKNMVVAYHCGSVFNCQADLAYEGYEKDISVSDYDVFETSFAALSKGSGEAKLKVLDAVVDLFTDAYWSQKATMSPESGDGSIEF